MNECKPLAGGSAEAEGKKDAGEIVTLEDGTEAAPAEEAPPPPPAPPPAPQFVGERCLSVLIRVGQRLVARDFSDLAPHEVGRCSLTL